MLTLFSVPKPFLGDTMIIQNNAIRSWALLRPGLEIILLGDDEGTSETAQKFCIRNIPEMERNEYGTPLLNSVFELAQTAATNPVLCYINSDIMLMHDFVEAIQAIVAQFDGKPFLAIGRRWDLDVRTSWDFENPEWQAELRNHATTKGKLHAPTGFDYFVFPKGLWTTIPPLLLGRGVWDHWLVHTAKRTGASIIDLTPSVVVVHQNHDYGHIRSPGGVFGVELKHNKRFFNGSISVWDATHVLTPQGLKKAGAAYQFRKLLFEVRHNLTHVSIWFRSIHPRRSRT